MPRAVRRTFGVLFALVGFALIGRHLFFPLHPNEPYGGHDMIIMGIGAIIAAAWFWEQDDGSILGHLSRDDWLGVLFFSVGTALVGHNWWYRQLEAKTTLAGILLMVGAAHYISMEKSTRIVKSLTGWLPLLRRDRDRDYDRDPDADA